MATQQTMHRFGSGGSDAAANAGGGLSARGGSGGHGGCLLLTRQVKCLPVDFNGALECALHALKL
jgi:hypothetical protein